MEYLLEPELSVLVMAVILTVVLLAIDYVVGKIIKYDAFDVIVLVILSAVISYGLVGYLGLPM